MYSSSSWEVPALERLAGIQSKPVLKKGFRVGGCREGFSGLGLKKMRDPRWESDWGIQVRGR